MSAELVPGQARWRMTQDELGFRDYDIVFRVRTTSALDGPYVVSQCPGLPVAGSAWNFDNDSDPWSFCRLNKTVTPDIDDEPNRYWRVGMKFSNRPLFRCDEANFGNPLLEPQRVSGGTTRVNRSELLRDKDGNFIVNSSHQLITGLSFDASEPSVRVQQNVAVLGESLWAPMMNTVNSGPLWGMPARCVKLSAVNWSANYYGACLKFYTRTFDFNISMQTNPLNPSQFIGFDLVIPDKGTSVLNGHWATETEWGVSKFEYVLDKIDVGAGLVDPNKNNPAHFVQYRDQKNQPGETLLDGEGKPATNKNWLWTGTKPAGAPNRLTIQYYRESNFFLLGIPATL